MTKPPSCTPHGTARKAYARASGAGLLASRLLALTDASRSTTNGAIPTNRNASQKTDWTLFRTKNYGPIRATMAKKHLNFIRSLPCVICGDNTATEACHVRMSDARIAKPESGIGRKPPDYFTVPMCSKHHRQQHEGSERKWWENQLLDPVIISLALYAATDDYEQGINILEAATNDKFSE